MRLHLAAVVVGVIALGVAYARHDAVGVVFMLVVTIVALVGVVGRMEQR